jgi:predicted dehydrogenase
MSGAFGASGPVRFGLVGCGRIGAFGDDRAREWPGARLWLPFAHASAIQKAGGHLAAVCDSNAEALEACARRFSVGRTYSDYRLMVDRESLDVLSIGTRTKVRPEIVTYAATRNIRGIYCEKPLSNTLEQADELADLLTKNGVVFLYGPQRRYMLAFTAAAEHVRRGDIGRLAEIVIRWPAGPLLWRHPHSVDLACFLAGDAEVDAVEADVDLDPSSIRGHVVDADPIVRSGTIHFATDIRARIVIDDADVVELRGDSGTISVAVDGLQTTLRRGPVTEPVPVAPGLSGTATAMQILMSSVRGAGRPPYDISHAVRNQEILFGWLESHLTGKEKIHFPLPRTGRLITGRSGEKLA